MSRAGTADGGPSATAGDDGAEALEGRVLAVLVHVVVGIAIGLLLSIAALALTTPRGRAVPGTESREARPDRPKPIQDGSPEPLSAVFRAHAFEVAVGLVVGLLALGVTVFLFGRSA